METIMSVKASFVRQLAQLSLIGFAYFLGAVAVLHVLRPDYDPISRTISEYANGAYGFLMTSSFVMLGLGSGALVLALARDGWASSGRSRIGIAFFTLWSVGVLVLSIFPTDRYGIPVSRNGIIHSFVALIAFVCLVLASVLLSLRFRHHVQWLSVARPSLTLAILIGISLVVFLVSPAAFKGITERVLILVVLVWLCWVVIKLRALYSTSSVKLFSLPLTDTI
jgi:hypothetical protein